MAEVRLADDVIDDGLAELDAVDEVHICSSQPTDYDDALSKSLGLKTVGTGFFGTPEAGSPGRRSVSGTIDDGEITANGTATHWAALDTASSPPRLLATGPLNGSVAVTDGQSFTLGAISVHALTGLGALLSGDLLLGDEADSFAVEASVEGGSVSVRDSASPPTVTELSNVGLDASNLTQSSTGPKMVFWDSAPFVKWSPHNLLPYSEALNSWSGTNAAAVTPNATTAPNGNVTADLLTEGIQNDVHDVQSVQISTQANTVYTCSFYAKANGRTKVEGIAIDEASGRFSIVLFDLSGVSHASVGDNVWQYISSDIESAPFGFYRCILTIKAITSTIAKLWLRLHNGSSDSYTGDGSSGAYFWGAQINRGYDPLPYLATPTGDARIGIPQEYDADEGTFGILIEPAATNLTIESEGFAGAAWASDVGLASKTGGQSAPDGSATAVLLTEDTSNNTHNTDPTANVALDQTTNNYTFSVFAKAGTSSYLNLLWFKNGGSYETVSAIYDLSDGSIIDASTSNGAVSASADIIPIGGGWYRCILTGRTGNNAGMEHRIGMGNGTTGYQSYVGTGKTLYVWGAQNELGDTASSYIPTGASPVTRAADIIKAATTTFPWSSTNGSIYVKYKPRLVSAGSRYVWQAYKDANNHISLLGDTANPTLENTQASTQDVALDAGTLVANTLTRVSAAFKANDFDVSQDAGAVQSDAAATLTTGYTDLYIGTKGSATGEELNGYVYQLLYVPYQRETVNSDLDTWKSGA